MQIFLDYVIFNLEVKNSNNFVFRQFPINSKEFTRLFLVRLQLYIKYEDQTLLLKEEVFEFLKSLFLGYLELLSGEDQEDLETTKDYSLIIFLSSKTFMDSPSLWVKDGLDFHLVKCSMLHHLGTNLIFSSSTFWKTYFSHKSVRPRSNSSLSKMKHVKTSETMVYYYYIISLDIKLSAEFVESCIPHYTTSFNLIKGFVKLQLGDVIYSIAATRKKNKQESLQTFSIIEKLPFILNILMEKQFLISTDTFNLMHLNKFISSYLQKCVLQHTLATQKMSLDLRKFVWIKYIKHDCDVKKFESVNGNTVLSKETKHQIQIDVVRTKKWKGDAYQERLHKLLLNFFEQADVTKEYFQGFNYILAFLQETFDKDEDCLLFAKYISEFLIHVGL